MSYADCALMAWAAPNGCDWCGGSLPPRRRRWCSPACARLFENNHSFSRARTVIRRRCRIRGVGYRCQRCEQVVEAIEVNHIEPCRGKHSKFGCWHHLSNLEGLCRPCHLEVTAEQRSKSK